MAMGTPKKPVNKKVEPKNTDEEEDDDNTPSQAKRKADDDDDDFDGPLDDIGFDNLDYDDDDDY